MFNKIILYFAKNILLKTVNSVLKDYYSENLQVKLRFWITNLRNILDLFVKIEDRLSDSELTVEELTQTKQDLEVLLENFKNED